MKHPPHANLVEILALHFRIGTIGIDILASIRNYRA